MFGSSEIVAQLRELNSQLQFLRAKVEKAELLYLLSRQSGGGGGDIGKIIGGLLGPSSSKETDSQS